MGCVAGNANGGSRLDFEDRGKVLLIPAPDHSAFLEHGRKTLQQRFERSLDDGARVPVAEQRQIANAHEENTKRLSGLQESADVTVQLLPLPHAGGAVDEGRVALHVALLMQRPDLVAQL